MSKKSEIANLRVLNLQDARSFIEACMAARLPVFMWGQPGVGKSDLIQQIGNAQGRPVIDMRLLLCEPTDIKGIPYYDPESKTMRWAPPSELPRADSSFANAILFLDEMNAAPPSVQGAAYQLILNRRVGEYRLPDGVDMIAAGNRESDKGIAYQMPTPLANRFVHVNVEVNLDCWTNWATSNGIHPDIVGYLQHRKANLNTFDPKAPEKSFATPRTWAYLSKLLWQPGISDSLMTDLVAGCVGSGIAFEFMEHREFTGKMPRAEDVLSGKVTSLKIDKISAHYSLVISLCYTLKEMNEKQQDGQISAKDYAASVDNFLKFSMDNFSPEMIIMACQTALVQYRIMMPHKQLKHFDAFFKEYSPYVL